ncbi:Alpha/Beta hydrolase protein [Desarmillaria tabescens]|uniref:Alpha/Beta hydrolase protein n=1 Tax=Armillaria tabescens TaxID=1929756 RepID=A0AA39JWG2_ARMTA|nr:Alpha/Beta hydrolase protein [Desarmillaria tabescens]KAK0449070.1 Alpha/Beta hydrolase protein [Desarmillaria tabescens]
MKCKSTQEIYMQWTRSIGLPYTVDTVPGIDETKILWIGPKRLEKVLFYCHGGGYMISALDAQFNFYRYLQLELEKRGIHVGVAMMTYKLLPEHQFPTQLRQARDALAFLIQAGVHPRNIMFAGESAGANLVIQTLSHILHCLPSVQPLKLTTDEGFRGVLLISPWVSMKADSELPWPLLHAKHKYDILSSRIIRLICRTLMKDIPRTDINFVDPIEAPKTWFDGLDNLVDRILITYGELEGFAPGVQLLYEKYLKPCHEDVKALQQRDGVHGDPILKFVWKQEDLGEIVPAIVDWVAELFMN